MDYTAVNREEKNNQKKGAATSFVIHIALLILAILPLLTFPDPPPGQSGVLVAFGQPDVGQGDDPAPPPAAAEEAKAPEETEAVEEVKKVEPKPEKPKQVKEKVKPTKKVNSDANSREIALKKKKAAEAKEKARKEANAKKLADAKKKAADDAKRKAAAKKKAAEAAAAAKKAADAEKWKNIGAGVGSGKTTTPGNAGQNDGDPDGKALDGVSTGSGEIGGNLGGRDVLYKPKITDNTQKVGNVVVKVCVDSNGKVVSAKYTQAGSTATDSGLIATAVKAAKKYRFDKGTIDKQCGTIKIKFRLK